MTRIILAALSVGMLSGYFLIPTEYKEAFLVDSETGLIIGLCILLFLVGVDLGLDGKVVKNFKKLGARILLLPIGVMLGTLAGALLASLFLPITGRESMAVGAGFGWYSLAPIILTKYSAELSAISFTHNIMRELFGILLIPFVAKHIGYIEACSLPGSASADVCLPIVERCTNANIAAYSFVSGMVLSGAVPLLVPLIAGV